MKKAFSIGSFLQSFGSTNKSQRLIILITCFALAIRVIYILVAPQIDPVVSRDPLYGDAQGYHLLALNLLQGYGLSWDRSQLTSYRAPGYPAFLATTYSITGLNFFVIRLIQAILGALTCIPVFLIGKQLAGQLVGTFSGLGIALYPLLVYLTAWLYTETLFIFMLWLSLWLIFRLYQTNNLNYAWMGGILMGLTALVRPQIIIFPLFCFILGFGLRWNGRFLRQLLLVQAAILLVVLPWTLRNIYVHQAFVLVTTDTGPNLYGANNPNSDGGFGSNDWDLPGMTEVESDKEFSRRAIQWITQNPVDFMKLLPAKLLKYFSPLEMTTADRSFGKLEFWINGLYGIYLLLAFWGGVLLVVHPNTKGPTLILIAFVLYSILITLVFHGGARLALPITPALIIFAVFGIVRGVTAIYFHWASQFKEKLEAT